MAASAKSGAQFIFGNLSAMLATVFGTNAAVPDPDQDAGPSGVYQGWAFLDPRILYTKDQVTGYTGKVQSHLMRPDMKSVGAVPAALSASNIAGAQGVTNGTAMTFAAASTGITRNVPIRPFSGVLNGVAPVTAAVAIDFGFAFGNCTAGSVTITVADSTQFILGEPIVIGGVGNTGGTTPLLTNVLTIVDATHITVINAPLATNAVAPIGTGDLWGPSEIGFPTPQAAFPFLASGPALVFDPSQGISRGLQIVGASGGTGGTFTVSGWDIYGDLMTQLVTVAAGASTGYTTKTFKYIGSIVPNFTDTTHNYTVGTSDLFGFNYVSRIWEETTVFWAGASMASATGWVAAVTTNPSTNLTGDVRGTIQVSATGPGSGIGATASNGTVSGLVMTGNRLKIAEDLEIFQVITATQSNSNLLFGVTQN
jgi:hypothetical protein